MKVERDEILEELMEDYVETEAEEIERMTEGREKTVGEGQLILLWKKTNGFDGNRQDESNENTWT